MQEYPPQDQICSFQNVSLVFEDRLLFQDLNFDIRSGELLGILGPNGCGKTSLLKMMSGVLKPQSGVIQLQSKNLQNYSRKEISKIMAVLPQENYWEFPFSALEVVLMGRAPHWKRFQWESAEDLKIAKEAMQNTDCWQFAKRDIRTLSGGEKERVLLARALAQQTPLLLLDEPNTHLDLRHQWEMFQLLQKLNAQGLTIVIVLHDLYFARRLCKKVLLLSPEGQLEGSPEEILTPEHLQKAYDLKLCSENAISNFWEGLS